ncbi:MAG: exonuclease subunit SbcD [Leptospiraceae bacterium]|nr:exonuclease subunit SbcD [Leptospiraceae bacterium]MCP5496124.1 exonuclease subunit SbcD [Leptospiraceae bacterium]
MRILHTSDWHLGKNLESFSRLEEQIEVLEEILEISDRFDVDAILIAGDLFDTFNPPAKAVEIFYKYLKRLTKSASRPVIAIAGNHDSPDRIEAPDPLAKECGIFFCGYPESKHDLFVLESGVKISKVDFGFLEILLPNSKYPLRIITTPYANEKRLKIFLGVENEEEELQNCLAKKWKELAGTYLDDKGVNILLTHLFMMEESGNAPIETESEKPIVGAGGTEVLYTSSIPPNVHYVALGHLHRCQTIAKKPCSVVYSGSPLAYSMSEANQNKYVLLLDMEPQTKAKIQKVRLTKCKKLLRQKFSNIEDALVWLRNNQDSYVEITIQTNTFLKAEEERKLRNAHDKIVNVIPEILENSGGIRETERTIDLNRNIEDLFEDYFKYKKGGQAPSDVMKDLFRELLILEETE